jgi:hypothetical protein
LNSGNDDDRGIGEVERFHRGRIEVAKTVSEIFGRFDAIDLRQALSIPMDGG